MLGVVRASVKRSRHDEAIRKQHYPIHFHCIIRYDSGMQDKVRSTVLWCYFLHWRKAT